ncbi:MAG: DUF721 domain-containing protein [Gammaproteobacteria bacterium]|nr:MAG: DUF721 domain-containing protein [Gammaproteobacteria bacterium]
MRSNKPLRINKLLGKSELSRLLGHARSLKKLDAELHDLIPPPLGDHCRILSIRDDTLVLAADSPVWAARLRFQATQLAKQLSDRRTVNLRTVRVRVRPPESRHKAPPARKHIPISRKNFHALRQAAREITDPGLRAALLRLASRRNGSDNT